MAPHLRLEHTEDPITRDYALGRAERAENFVALSGLPGTLRLNLEEASRPPVDDRTTHPAGTTSETHPSSSWRITQPRCLRKLVTDVRIAWLFHYPRRAFSTRQKAASCFRRGWTGSTRYRIVC